MTDTLSEIFARDPFSLTRDGPEIEAMVSHFRTQRHQFKASEASGQRPSTSRKPKMSKEEAAQAVKDLNLDLDL